MKEYWEKKDENGTVIERGINEKAMESVTLKKDSKGNIVWEIKAYGLDIEEAMEKAIKTKRELEDALADADTVKDAEEVEE